MEFLETKSYTVRFTEEEYVNLIDLLCNANFENDKDSELADEIYTKLFNNR